MKMMARCLAMLALSTALTGAVQAETYNGLYVFGDSLVDGGNAFLATGGAEANPVNGYYMGRFSNGLNFADYLSVAVTGMPTIPAFIGGHNVAVGGADAQTKPGQISPSFIQQVGFYNSFVAPTISNDALVLVTFGGNDVRDTIGVGGTVDFSAAASDFSTGLNLLYGLGARNFLITGAPDIGLLPVSTATVGGDIVRLEELTQRSEDISALFAAEGAALAALPGAQVTFFDLFAYEHQLLADPAAFGLSPTLNTTTPCQIPGGGSPQTANCSNSLYFDAVHPTTQVHSAIAQAILTELDNPVPEPATWMTIITGFGLVGMAMRRRSATPALLAA